MEFQRPGNVQLVPAAAWAAIGCAALGGIAEVVKRRVGGLTRERGLAGQAAYAGCLAVLSSRGPNLNAI